MADQDTGTTEQPQDTPLERAEPIESRFLFVDVAAQRAKQLRRGARPRLNTTETDPVTGWRPDQPHKLERVAMEEVKQGFILYTLPETPSSNRTNG